MRISSIKQQYRLVEAPSQRFPFHVVRPDGLPDFCLSAFASHLSSELSMQSIPVYMRELLALANWTITDPVVRHHTWRLFGPPDQVRNIIRQYITTEAACKITTRPDTLGQQTRYIRVSSDTRINPRVFLSALKRLFSFLIERRLYDYANPLVHEEFEEARKSFRSTESQAFRGVQDRAPMPQLSGVDSPFRHIRLSENYFRCVDRTWIPKTISDPNFPAVIYNAGKRFGWKARELCIARILFESGGRISEVCALTVGDWSHSQFLNEFASPSKGSHGLRVKTLRVSHPTVKMLKSYFNDEREGRRAFNREKVSLSTVERAFRQPRRDPWSHLADAPIFLSKNGAAFTAENFRQHYWKPALASQGIEADPHLARHWFVTNAMKNISQACKSSEEADYEKRKLIAYMAWRSGEKTLRCYEHSTSKEAFGDRLDLIHREMRKNEKRALTEEDRGSLVSSLDNTVSSSDVMNDDLAFILGEDDD